MKKVILPFLLIALFIIAAGALPSVTGQNEKSQTEFLDEFMNLEPFTAINIGVSADVTYTTGKKHGLTVSGDEDDIEDLIIEVKGKTLSISYPGYRNRHSRLDIHIVSEELESVKISGSAHFIAESTVESDEMELAVSGSGKIIFSELLADEGDVKISGSGGVEIREGEADECDAIISGSGRMKAAGFEVDEFSAKISGSGNCEINAVDELEAVISGSGRVYYNGSPQVNSTISGSGKVKKL